MLARQFGRHDLSDIISERPQRREVPHEHALSGYRHLMSTSLKEGSAMPPPLGPEVTQPAGAKQQREPWLLSQHLARPFSVQKFNAFHAHSLRRTLAGKRPPERPGRPWVPLPVAIAVARIPPVVAMAVPAIAI